MRKRTQQPTQPPPVPKRRAPLLRSANWVLLLGAVGGAIYGGVQVYYLHGGIIWITLGVLLGVPLGIVAGGDLLIPGPAREIHLPSQSGNRVGPLRWGVLCLLLMLEGLIFAAYLTGTITLTCQRLESQQIDCHRRVQGWLNSRLVHEIHFDHVVSVGLDVHNELLLYHGPYEQGQSAPGFGTAAVTQVQAFLDDRAPTLTLTSTAWTTRLAAPVCLLIALLTGAWAFLSLRHGRRLLRQQFALGEVYWGWRR